MSNQTQTKKRRISPITWILIILIVILLLLSTFTTGAVGSITAKNKRQDMITVAAERAKVIEDYAIWAEDTLTNFSHAGQIRTLLENPNDPSAITDAQKLVDDFSEDVGDLEGLYIASWSGTVLAHSVPEAVGTPLATSDEDLENIHNQLENAYDKVFNFGMMESPASGKQIVAANKAIRNDYGEAIGFVGLGIFTENLLNDLADVQLSGLQNSQYALVDANTNAYLYHPDKSMIGTTCDVSEIQTLNQDLQNGSAEESGIAVTGVWFNGGASKNVIAYQYVKDYNWTFLVIAPTSDVYRMTYQLQTFVTIFGVLIVLLVIVFGIINAHQEAINRKLGNEILKNEATKESLETAMFNDILTDASNRTSLEMALDKVHTDRDHPCYFAMFDISGLSAINAQFGNDAGDTVLCRTADILKESFPEGTVYRTGDDEFVVAIQKNENSTAAYNQVYRDVNTAHGALIKPIEVDDGTINVVYKIALVRTCDELSTDIVAVLKDITKHNGVTNPGQVTFVDIDEA